MDRRLYDLQSARAFLRAAVLCLGYAASYLDLTDPELYNELRKIRPVVEEILQRLESKLGTYLPPSEDEEDLATVPSARRILEEVILGHG